MRRTGTGSTTAKEGFTLIELVLVMAITLILASIFFAVFSIVNTSHANIAMKNDAKDYAELNMEAISNILVNSDKIKFTGTPALQTGTDNDYSNSLYFDSASGSGNYSGKLYNDTWGDTPYADANLLFSYYQYTVGSTAKNKWYIVATFSLNADVSLVDVTLAVMDNAKPSAAPYTTLHKSIYLPNITSHEGTTGSVIKFHRTSLG